MVLGTCVTGEQKLGPLSCTGRACGALRCRPLPGAHLWVCRGQSSEAEGEGVSLSELDASLGTNFLLPLGSPRLHQLASLLWPSPKSSHGPASVAMETASLRGLASISDSCMLTGSLPHASDLFLPKGSLSFHSFTHSGDRHIGCLLYAGFCFGCCKYRPE